MTNRIHSRYLRYRDFDLFRYSNNFLSFLDQQATRLIGTGTPVDFVADDATDQLLITAHTYTTGDPVRVSTTTTLPAGLAVDTTYWVEDVDANNIKLHTSLDNAQVSATPVDITDTGTGTQSIENSADSFRIYEALLSGKSAHAIRGITDVDDL